MSRFITDKDGDHLQVIAESDGALNGVTIAATLRDEVDGETTTYHATVGPVDPHVLIEAIKAECELHEDDEENEDEGIHSCPDCGVVPCEACSPVVEAVAEQINAGKATLSFEEAVGRRSSGEYVHTTPATAEEPRLWAGADEPIIDSLIGRVADLEDEGPARARRELERQQADEQSAHQHLSEHWERRLKVVEQALTMLPAPRRQGGLAAVFAGEDVPDPLRVENALKIARFAADEERDIPGVDR